jgi:signal transduction histidine kinase
MQQPISPLELRKWRLIFLMSAIAYPAWGWFFENFYSDAIESGRFSVGLCLIAFATLTYIHEFFVKHIFKMINLSMALVIAHYFYLVYLNQINLLYVSSAFICVNVVHNLATTQKSSYAHAVYIFLLASLVIFVAPSNNLNGHLFLLGTFTILAFSIVVNINRMRYMKMLTEQQAQLVTSSRLSSLGEMAAGIAHEINNPLTIIHGQVNKIERLMKAEQLDNEILTKSITSIQKTVERIGSIVRGLRFFARDGQQDPFVELSLQQLFDETLIFCGERFVKNNVRLEIDKDQSHIFILCRPVQLTQVFVNLLNNSFDAVQQMTGPWVKVEVKDHDTHIQLHFIDSGRGISENIANRIMEPFFTTKAPGSGTGLGLSISKGIVENHSGGIELMKSSRNTCFVVTLPKVRRNSNSSSTAA